MDSLIPLIIVGIISIPFIMMIPSLVTHTIGQLLLGRVDDFEGWDYYGTLLERRGHLLQAYNAYQRSLEINPLYSKAQNHLDDLLVKLGRDRNTADPSFTVDADY
jgi:tetratricopeptide (TPR) repeat protein